MTRSLMNNLLARCSHLFPSLREAWYAIPLRLIVGYGFMEHGYAKLARGPDNFAAILHALGMPAPMLLSWTTVILELLGGLAVFARSVYSRWPACQWPSSCSWRPSLSICRMASAPSSFSR